MIRKKFFFIVLILIVCFAIIGCASRIELIDHLISTGNNSSAIIVAQVSDLHFKPKNLMNPKCLNKLREINPDILLLTGDIVDNPDTLDAFDRYLDEFDFILYKFAVLGNWEKGGRMSNPGNLSKLKDIYVKHKIILLVNDCYPLHFKGRSLLISGLDDYLFGDPQWESRFIDTSAINLVLLHEPALFDIIVDSIKSQNPKYCVVFSGHTHGGQIRFGKIPIILPPGSGNYIDGIYKKEGISLIVSKGLGTSSLYIRIGAKPDIVVITIQ